jgi:hypothetical protein
VAPDAPIALAAPGKAGAGAGAAGAADDFEAPESAALL